MCLSDEIFLLPAEEYNFMSNGMVKIPGVQDDQDMDDTREAMDIMQLSAEDQTGELDCAIDYFIH